MEVVRLPPDEGEIMSFVKILSIRERESDVTRVGCNMSGRRPWLESSS